MYVKSIHTVLFHCCVMSLWINMPQLSITVLTCICVVFSERLPQIMLIWTFLSMSFGEDGYTYLEWKCWATMQIFIFIRYRQFFQRDCTIPPISVMRILVAPFPHQHLKFFSLFHFSHSVSIRWYHVMVPLTISSLNKKYWTYFHMLLAIWILNM